MSNVQEHQVQAVALSQRSSREVDAPAGHDDIRVKSTHPALSRRRVTKTQWARYPVPVSGYERKIAKFTAHCTHTIKITRF